MNILLQNANIDDRKLKSYLINVVANELTNLSEPCYFPKLKVHYFQILHLCNLTENEVKDSVQRFYKDTPIIEKEWKLEQNVYSTLLIALMSYYLNKKDIQTYNSLMLYFVVMMYTNLMLSHIRYCNPDIFRYTLEHLNKTHLFSREKTISGALFFIGREMSRRYPNTFQELNDPMLVSKFIRECRHRISQSVKSFRELYYRTKEEGVGFKNPMEDEEGTEISPIDRKGEVIEKVVKKITMYKEVDRKALEDARKITKIRESLATMIVHELSDIKYSDDVKMILELFVKDLKDVKSVCDKEFYKYVRSLMAIKKTLQKVFFKQQVVVLLEKIFTRLDYMQAFHNFTTQTQFFILSFLAFYITIVFRNFVC
jgi:hypothetical protein